MYWVPTPKRFQARRPDRFVLDRDHYLSDGLVFAMLGNGIGVGTNLAYDSAADFGKIGNHGTLSSGMDPATDWVWSPDLNRFDLSYDGINDFVTITNGFDAIKGNNYTSVVLWINLATTTNYPVPIDGGSTALGWGCQFGNPRTTMYWFRGGSYRTLTLSTDPSNAWHCLAMACSGSGDSGIFYYDGIPQSYTGVIGSMPTSDGQPIWLGSYHGASDYNTFVGNISDCVIYSRTLSAAEVGIFSNPSDPSYNGWIQSLRGWVPGMAVAGATQLIVGGSESLVESGSAALIQHHILTVQDSESIVESSSVLLSISLVVQSAESLVESTGPALTQHHVLAVGGSDNLVESGEVSLTQHHVLTVANSESITESGEATLTQHYILVVAGSENIVESGEVALTQHHTLVIANSESLVESGGVVLTQHQVLVVAGAENLVESAELTLTYHAPGSLVLEIEGSESLVESGTVSLTQHHVLIVAGSEVLTESGSISLTQHHVLIVAGSESLVESDEVVLLAQALSLIVEGAESLCESGSVLLTQHHVLTVSDSESLTESGNVMLHIPGEITFPALFLAS